MTTKQDDSDNHLVLGLHLNRMIESSGRDLSASTNERLKRFPPTGNVNYLQVQPGLLEIAQLLGDRKRCVLQECLSANGHPYRRSFQLGLLRLARPDLLWRPPHKRNRHGQQIASMQHRSDLSLRRIVEHSDLQKSEPRATSCNLSLSYGQSTARASQKPLRLLDPPSASATMTLLPPTSMCSQRHSRWCNSSVPSAAAQAKWAKHRNPAQRATSKVGIDAMRTITSNVQLEERRYGQPLHRPRSRQYHLPRV